MPASDDDERRDRSPKRARGVAAPSSQLDRAAPVHNSGREHQHRRVRRAPRTRASTNAGLDTRDDVRRASRHKQEQLVTSIGSLRDPLPRTSRSPATRNRPRRDFPYRLRPRSIGRTPSLQRPSSGDVARCNEVAARRGMQPRDARRPRHPFRRQAAAPSPSRWEAGDRSGQTCSAGATSVSGVMPASPVWADSEVGRVIAHGGMFGSFVTLNRSAVGLFESRPGESSGRFGEKHVADPRDVIRKGGLRQLRDGHVVAVGLQALDYGAPAPAVCPRSVDEDDVRWCGHGSSPRGSTHP